MLKKSGTKIPRIEVEEIGPSMDLVIRRTQLASDELFKQACKKPKELKVRFSKSIILCTVVLRTLIQEFIYQTKTKKNITRDGLANTLGRVHVGKQMLNTIQTRKMKGLKKSATERKVDRKRKSEAAGNKTSQKKAKDVISD